MPDVGELLDRCRREVRFRQRWKRITGIILSIIAVACLLVPTSLGRRVPDSLFLTLLALNVSTGVICWLLSKRTVAVRQIERLEQPESIGLLLEVCALGAQGTGIDRTVVNAARVTLLRLLTNETIAKLRGLETPQLRAACQMLRSTESPRFALQLLVLLEHIGGDESIPTLERVAALKANCRTQDVRQAAETALAVVQVRMAKAKDEAVLLRPSMSGNQESQLLRPVASSRRDGEAVLLRSETGDRIPGQ